MAQITIDNVSKAYGMKQLFNNVNFVINDEDKIGIIGINGTGKSTLLKIIAGIESPDKGTIIKSKNSKVAYLSQSPVFNDQLTVIEQVLQGDSEVFKVLREYELTLEQSVLNPQDSSISDRLLSLSETMTRLDAWELESQVKTILTKLSVTDFNQPVKELSGGQKKRLSLAASLISPCDLLILDEPTNHMDNATIDWLETYLHNRKGALLMITHDRYFLDRVTNRIVEIDHSQLFSYDGNYGTFLNKKLERLEMAQAMEQKRENLFRRELAWIRRGAKARSTKQKARIDRFELIKSTSYKRNDQVVELSVGYTRLGKKTIELQNISKSYDDLTLFKDFSYTFHPEDRVGIIGPNGAGKTTLLKSILGKIPLTTGIVEMGPTLNISYFSQEAKDMDHSLKAIDYIKETAEFITTKSGHKLSASVMLEKFLFDDELQYAPISSMSGGEKRRLYLLKTLMMAPNVIVLDEPTNDLDIDTLKVLEAYLDDFNGIVVAVSHDRYFLDRVCDKIFSFEDNGRIVTFTGNYTDYQIYKADFVVSEKQTEIQKEKTEKVKTKKIKMTYQEKQDYANIESDIEALESQLDELESALLKHQTDFVKLQSLSEAKEELEETLLDKMDYYEYLEDLNHQIKQQ